MIYLLFLPIIFLTVIETVIRKRTKYSGAKTVALAAFWRWVCGIIVFIVAVAVLRAELFAGFELLHAGVLFIRALLFFMSTAILINGLKYVNLAVADILQRFRILPLIALSWWLFDDVVGLWSIILAVFIFALCIALSIIGNRGKEQRKTQAKGLVLICISVTIVIINTVVFRYLGDSGVNIFWMFTFLATAHALIGLTVAIFNHIRKKENIKTFYGEGLFNPWMIVFGICMAVHFLLQIVLVTHMNIGIIDAVLVSAGMCVVLVSRFMFKEKLKVLQYVLIGCVLVASVALALVTYFGF
ncbi:MAG: hypothetical protein FWD89_05255 [Firmicutes bacterium]|nr:hypothetical protein [Bacillota bacterium]MCL2771690.1 hypothetical protein [Bacillota bacterium]